MTHNLISIRQFTLDNNVFFEFHPFTCLMKSHVSKQVLLEGYHGADALYHLPSLTTIPKESSHPFLSEAVSSTLADNSSSVSSINKNHYNLDNFSIWHNGFGHAIIRAIQTALSLCNNSISPKNTFGLFKSCSSQNSLTTLHHTISHTI